MNPSSAMALASAGVMSAARALNVSASTAASAAPMRFRLLVVFIVVSLRALIGLLILIRLLQLRRDPLAVNRFLFRPVEAHDHGKWTLGRGQPVGFLAVAGRVALDDQRQTAIGITLEMRQHR